MKDELNAIKHLKLIISKPMDCDDYESADRLLGIIEKRLKIENSKLLFILNLFIMLCFTSIVAYLTYSLALRMNSINPNKDAIVYYLFLLYWANFGVVLLLILSIIYLKVKNLGPFKTVLKDE